MNNFHNQLLTIDEVAEVLRMPKRQVYELTRRRTWERSAAPIPLLKVTGNTRFLRADVEGWIEKLAEHQGEGQ
jgi:excisionase family DNA binding protein